MSAARILIADADGTLAEFYRQSLSAEGWEVAVVSDALACVAQLRCFAPDVLVLDPELPWGGGDGVLELMHTQAEVPLIPVIVLAAGHDLAALYRVASFPISQWHDKPCAPPILTMSIRRLIRQPAPSRRAAGQVRDEAERPASSHAAH